MRPLRTFTIEPSLPETLAPLKEIARNLWWAWHGDPQTLFRRLSGDLWEDTHHNPMAMLGMVDQSKLEELSQDDGFISHMNRVYDSLQEYVNNPGWWAKKYKTTRDPQVAYFSAEFGISEAIPIYSGGLGVLAGDHLKSASDLDFPLVGVGLLYQQGYFRQRLNADGWQLELFPRNDFHNMPLEMMRNSDSSPMVIDIDMADRKIKACVWKIQVGRIPLYLLDTNVRENNPEDRHITAQLYGGDQEMRIRQEIVLGIGGVRMLQALGIRPKAFHMNEGHSAFLGIERIRCLMLEKGVNFEAAKEAVTVSNVFTTHTPVPAGNDAFDSRMIEKYFAFYISALGIDLNRFISMGRQDPSNIDEPMSLTVLALRLSNSRNGVSELHGEVSRNLWTGVWPAVPTTEVPVDHVTNGIHTMSWISHDMASLYDRYLNPDWPDKPATKAIWDAIDTIPDPELWRTHERRRERLVAFARKRLVTQLQKRGAGASAMAEAQEVLDPDALTIGFARRFATYKRATLLLSDLNRLAKLLSNPDKRVQIIFAGKAHPRDNPGKELIRDIIHFTRKEPFRRSVVFIDDYDMNVARYLVQGVDVWLNTPLRPMEASGTSGMKAAANGVLNLSILDGWWAEGYKPGLGWAIGSGETYDDLEYQNEVESQALYDLLEKEIVPMFYRRGSDKLPREWIKMMKGSMRELAPVFNTNRMVNEYGEKFYIPAAQGWDRLTSGEFGQSQELSLWKQKIHENFHNIRIESVNDDMQTEGNGTSVGKPLSVEAVVHLAGLTPNDVKVELYYGHLDDDGQLTDGKVATMKMLDHYPDTNCGKYSALVECMRSGLAGYTVRVLPQHPALKNPIDMGLIKWA